MSSQTNWKTLMLLFFHVVLTRVINMILLILPKVCFCKNKMHHYLVFGLLELEHSLWTTIVCVWVCVYVYVLCPFILRSLLSLQKIFLDALLPTMFNGTRCAQVHELPRKHCWDNQEGALFSWFYIKWVSYIYCPIFIKVCLKFQVGQLLQTVVPLWK